MERGREEGEGTHTHIYTHNRYTCKNRDTQRTPGVQSCPTDHRVNVLNKLQARDSSEMWNMVEKKKHGQILVTRDISIYLIPSFRCNERWCIFESPSVTVPDQQILARLLPRRLLRTPPLLRHLALLHTPPRMLPPPLVHTHIPRSLRDLRFVTTRRSN